MANDSPSYRNISRRSATFCRNDTDLHLRLIATLDDRHALASVDLVGPNGMAVQVSNRFD